MKPPLTPMMTSPCSIPAFPAALSGATSMTFRTSRPLTWTCSARIPSRCTIDPAPADVEVEGGAAAAGAWPPLVFRRRLEDMDVNLVAGCRCLHSLGVGWRPAIFRPRDFNLDHVINLCLSGAAEDLAHDPIDDDGRPFLGLGGPLGGRGRAKHAHDAQRDRGSDHRSLGVTHVCSLN